MNYQDLYNTEYVECPGERHFFLPKLTSYFYHLIFSSYLINEIGKPKFFVYFLSAPLFDMCEVDSGNSNIHC